MKRLFTVFLIVILTFSMCYIQPVNAGAPQLVYKTVTKTGSAVMQSIKARKGLRTVPELGPNWNDYGEIIIDGMAKGIQDTAVDSFETINGGKFDKTPLKGMPGWLKVTLGTAAFLTGADIALDIFNKIQNGEPVSHVTPEGLLSSAVVNDVTYYTTFNESNKTVYMESSSGIKQYVVDVDDMHSYSTLISKGLEWVLENGAYQLYAVAVYNDYYYGRVSTARQKNGLPRITEEEYEARDGADTMENHGTTTLPKEAVEEVPSRGTETEVDPQKETQTLIIPDPEVYTDSESMNDAINENWEMVSDPEGWLQRNPDKDPDVGAEPGTDPGGETGTDPEPEPGTETPGGETPPVTEPPGDLDWTPLQVNFEEIKRKFPFSIPWDVYEIFNRFNVQPKTPKFDFSEESAINLGGASIPIDYDFTLDFGVFDPIAKIIRWGLIIVFDVAIIMALRRLTPD